MLAFAVVRCVFESPLTWFLAGRMCCCGGVNAVKGTLPTHATSSGTKCELQVVSGAMFALEYPLLIVLQTCFEMPFLPLLQCESPATDCRLPNELQSPSLAEG